MIDKLEKLAKPYIIIPLAVIFLFFMLYLFPAHQNEINDVIGKEFQSLDARFFYSKSDVMLAFEEIGEYGRKKYMFISGYIDMVYPLVYGMLFSLLLLRLTRKLPTKKMKWVCYVPLIAVLFDYIENVGVLKMLDSYPMVSESLVNLTSFATSGKWIFVLISILFLTGLGVFGLTRNKKNQ